VLKLHLNRLNIFGTTKSNQVPLYYLTSNYLELNVREVFSPLKRSDSPPKSVKEESVMSSKGSSNGESHSPEESPRSNVICRYYAGGYCSRGDKCFYSHDIDTAEQAPVQVIGK
jgi:hypothetical protein